MAVYTQIDNPELFFQCKIYTGTGSELAITLDGDENMQADLVWSKNRDQSEGHKIFDSVRGATKFIMSNNTDAESTAAQTLKSFDSDGVTIGTDADMNTSSEKNVLWCWKESATAGFDILTFTGNATSNQTISHNLSAVPKCFHIKRLDQASNWCSYHEGLGGANKNVFLNTTHASQTDTGIWNNTLPTSSVFSVGNNIDSNGNGASHVWYGWSEVQGFSKFGKYTGNGGSSVVSNADGTFDYTGFRPAWVMIKRTDTTNQWGIGDTKRDVDNPVQHHLFSESTQAEGGASSYNNFDILSNGFKLRSGDLWTNASGGTYIYMAFAEAPFVNSNGVPCNAR